ncbi:MAG: CBS domain-containing protein [Candidatus Nezhaarchaeota archaeon]|nr:CBS domain-containing protein [Candidatus Nezhaarchaeota archaeon]
MPLTLKVKDVMEGGVVVVDGELTVREGLKKMIESGVWSVVVSDKGLPVGVVTERDILQRVIAKHYDPDKVTLKEIMTSPLLTIDPEAPLGAAWKLLVEKNVRRVYVVEGGKILGRVTQTGLFQKLLDALLALSSMRQWV